MTVGGTIVSRPLKAIRWLYGQSGEAGYAGHRKNCNMACDVIICCIGNATNREKNGWH